jgi:hypothetical protein
MKISEKIIDFSLARDYNASMTLTARDILGLVSFFREENREGNAIMSACMKEYC